MELGRRFDREGNQIILHIARTEGPICASKQELLGCEGFRRLVVLYEESLKASDSPLASVSDLPSLIPLLQTLSERPLASSEVAPLLDGIDRHALHDWVEGLYDFWRSFDRFVVLHSEPGPSSLDRRPYRSFNIAIESFTNMVRSAYRDICENITGDHPRIYRQVAAGCNVGLIAVPKGQAPYSALENVPFIRQVWIDPPMIIDPPTNKRSGAFQQVRENPLQGCTLDRSQWLCYPAQVGPLVVFVYFHQKFVNLGCSLANLFELATDAQIEKGPDAVYTFGVPSEQLKRFGDFPTVFYEDSGNGLVVGAVPEDSCFGYFGYLKKMVLTLHNIVMMKRNRMPFHGAMVRLSFKDAEPANVLILGDTGTGKSECLEALRKSGAGRIREMIVVADDMGSIALDEHGGLRGYGTETGAFIRLDDLDQGFAFGQIDRSIIMSPQKVNARVVLPVTTLKHVLHGYPVQYLLYANNYETVESGTPVLERFTGPEQALPVFRDGVAMSKGTTTSTGLVRTYFANVFGPAQYVDMHEPIARRVFDAAFRAGVYVGQLRTQLGIPGYEKIGPERAADALLELITKAATPKVDVSATREVF